MTSFNPSDLIKEGAEKHGTRRGKTTREKSSGKIAPMVKRQHPTEEDRRQGDRRKHRAKFVLRERRCGFDRRAISKHGLSGRFNALLLAIRDNPGVFVIILITLNALNAIDYVLTLGALGMGREEANPVMRALFSTNPEMAALFKVVVVVAATLLIWQVRRFRGAIIVAGTALAVFTMLFAYHVVGSALIS